MARILIVDRNAASRQFLTKVVSEAGHVAETLSEAHSLKDRLDRTPFDAIFADWECFQGQEVEFLEKVSSRTPDTILVILVEQGAVDLVLRTFRSTHHEFLVKPLRVEEILRRLSKALAFRRLRDENSYLRNETGIDMASPGILGSSPSMREVHRQIAKVANSPSTALISGELGTEKSEVAAAIHLASNLHHGPFLKFSCGRSDQATLERELFGGIGGQAGDALEPRRGIFEKAEGGTALILEVGQLPMALQAGFLRFLQRTQTARIGLQTPTRNTARVLVTASEPLAPLVEEGRFLQELYDLLSDIEIHIPPLRQRREDIPHIALRLIETCCRTMGIGVIAPEPEVLTTLSSYSWPGNLMELNLILERAILLGDRRRIRITDLQHLTSGEPSDLQDNLKLARRQFELSHSSLVLTRCGGDRIRAARALGISHSTLYRILRLGQDRSPAARSR